MTESPRPLSIGSSAPPSLMENISLEEDEDAANGYQEATSVEAVRLHLYALIEQEQCISKECSIRILRLFHTLERLMNTKIHACDLETNRMACELDRFARNAHIQRTTSNLRT